jgi:hypothetical protein
VLMPALGAGMSWFQGQLVHHRRTRAVTEGVGIYLVASTGLLLVGVGHGGLTGVYVGLGAVMLGTCLQVGWLAVRCRRLRGVG